MGLPAVTLGGDPGSIQTVADWMRAMADGAEEANDIIQAEICSPNGLWDDDAALAAFSAMNRGIYAADQYIDQLRKRAQLIENYAESLARAQQWMAEAVKVAESVELFIKDGCIWPPHRWDRPYGRPELNSPEALLQLYQGRRTQFHTAQQLVEDANSKVVDALEKTTNFDWSSLVFASGDFVKNYIGELVKKGTHVSPVGLTFKVLRVVDRY